MMMRVIVAIAFVQAAQALIDEGDILGDVASGDAGSGDAALSVVSCDCKCGNFSASCSGSPLSPCVASASSMVCGPLLECSIEDGGRIYNRDHSSEVCGYEQCRYFTPGTQAFEHGVDVSYHITAVSSGLVDIRANTTCKGDPNLLPNAEIYEPGLNTTSAAWHTTLNVTLSGDVSDFSTFDSRFTSQNVTYREQMRFNFALDIGVSEDQVALSIVPASVHLTITTYSSTADKAKTVEAAISAKFNSTAAIQQLLTVAGLTAIAVESEPYTTVNVPPSPPPALPNTVPIIAAIVIASLAGVLLLASLVILMGARAFCEGAALLFFAPETLTIWETLGVPWGLSGSRGADPRDEIGVALVELETSPPSGPGGGR